MINITGTNLEEFVQHVYELSEPQGMGFVHYEEGPLTEDEIKQVLENSEYERIVLSMDYIKGRACKMTVFKEGDQLLIRDSWFDHSEKLLDELLERISIKRL